MLTICIIIIQSLLVIAVKFQVSYYLDLQKKIKIVLTGDGGDEISGGYNRYLYFKQYHKFFNKNIFFKILLKLSIPILYKFK